MKNKFSKSYIPVIDIKETQAAQVKIKEILLKELNNNFELTYVRPPMFSNEKQVSNFSEQNKNRTINFESLNNKNIKYIFNNFQYWLLKTINKLEIKNNNGIYSIFNFIDRDVETTNISSMEKNILEIEYRFDNKEKIFEKSMEIANKLISIILNVEEQIIKEYPNLKKSFFKKYNELTLDDKKLTSEKINYKNKEFSILNSKYLYILKYSQNEKVFATDFKISLESFHNVIKETFSIFEITNRKKLSEIESYISESEKNMNEYFLIKDLVGKSSERTINIKINLDLLTLLLLNKEHILEIQNGYNPNDIKKIFDSFNINFL